MTYRLTHLTSWYLLDRKLCLIRIQGIRRQVRVDVWAEVYVCCTVDSWTGSRTNDISVTSSSLLGSHASSSSWRHLKEQIFMHFLYFYYNNTWFNSIHTGWRQQNHRQNIEICFKAIHENFVQFRKPLESTEKFCLHNDYYTPSVSNIFLNSRHFFGGI